jgi:tetratricopeptide (TPR) repeat protein
MKNSRMSTSQYAGPLALLAGLVAFGACAPKHIHEEPILQNGDRVDDSSATVYEASVQAEADRLRGATDREAIEAEALASCAPEVCDAVVRREVWLGMNEVQVMAATATTEQAWSVRRAGGSIVMTPRDRQMPPSDAVGNLAMVQLADNAVQRYGYRESQGMRVVTSPDQATTEGRAAAMAETLIQEGDRFAAVGDLDAALDRYDRASVLSPSDPLVDYRIATVLDQALRPIEAQVQYELFLHRLDLERIAAQGDANAKLAEAIALAQQRIVILERSR